MKSDKTTKPKKTTKVTKETKVEEPEVPKVKWSTNGDTTHGHKGYNLFGVSGLIREKGCREIGGMMTRIYHTSTSDAPLSNRATDDEKWTVVLTGTHEAGNAKLDVTRCSKHGVKSRKLAMIAARHPSAWSKKARQIVEKIAKDKIAQEKAAEEAKAKAKEETKEKKNKAPVSDPKPVNA